MSQPDLATLHAILRQNGHQITKARENLFTALQFPDPQTIQEILQKSKGKIDRVSVYRNIELFEKLGIVHRVYIGWKYKIELTDNFTHHHHHLTCLNCGKIIDIADEQHINEFIKRVTHEFGFTPRRHQFEIDGYCRDCS